MEMNRRIGMALGVQLVVDALKLSPANPTFLDMRDAIFAALDGKTAAGQMTTADSATAKAGAWAAFAKFGMGPAARADDGAAFSGAVADFNVPPSAQPQPANHVHVSAAPNIAIPDKEPTGVASSAAVSQAGKITGVKVTVDIEHPYVGDLRVLLASPDGGACLLHTEGIDGSQDLKASYTQADTPSLATLLGRQAQGTWLLQVADMYRTSTGVLRQWTLDRPRRGLSHGGGRTG